MTFFQDNLDKLAPEKTEPFWILMMQEMMGGSGISWTICKSFTLHCRHNHASISLLGFTGWMPFLLPNQQCQSSEGKMHY